MISATTTTTVRPASAVPTTTTAPAMPFRRTSNPPAPTTTQLPGCSWAVNRWGNTDKPDPVYVDFVGRRAEFAQRTIVFAFDYTAPASGPASGPGTTYDAARMEWTSPVLTLTADMAGGKVTAHAREAGSSTDLCTPVTYTVDFSDPAIVRSDPPS
jgi:hypothetical protein